ncbi:hypothetical protein HF086_013512 [Spodoptera exigua]|uniref:Uncharacterized protein n=1 Tax=Spodoptera exigua TaxID=7107 RepID=A0A922M6A8_SPOEX|nr:hypothetical protein HF086_013512 [Spodoptera exigua]
MLVRQVFHKSVSQTCCVRESASALGSLIACVRDSTHMCLNVSTPKDFTAALDLYKDDLILTCDKVDEFVGEYAIRCEEILNSFVNMSANTRKAPKKQMKKRSLGTLNRSSMKNDAEARLSMYSLDTLRLNLHPKSSSSRDNQSSSVKNRSAKEAPSSSKCGLTYDEKPVETAKCPKRSRRPLMRDPHAGRPKAPKPIRENDIRTMVEAVGTVMRVESHKSRGESPLGGDSAAQGGRRAAGRAVARALAAPCVRPLSPAAAASLFAPPTVTPRTPRTPLASQQRHSPRPFHTPRNSHDPHSFRAKTKAQSPKIKKRTEEEKSKRPLNLITSVKETTSGIKNNLEPQDMMPVCKIQCAMKKDLKLEEAKQSARESSKKSPKKQRPVT